MPLPCVLVVGHGYLGSALASRLFAEGFPVAAVNRASSPPAPYPLYAADVGLESSLRALGAFPGFRAPGVIVHCASSSRGGAGAYRSVFLDGVRNLESIFPGTPLIFTGSSSVYAQCDGSLVDENSPASPDRETSRILLETEGLVREGGGIVLRLAGIYGPGRSVHLKRLFEGSATIEEGEISRYLNQIHRDDAVAAIVHLLKRGVENHRGAVFNVADDQPITQRDCYESLAALFGLPVPPTAPPDLERKRGWTNKRVSNAALRATGWSPVYPGFVEAVREDPVLVNSVRDGGSVGWES